MKKYMTAKSIAHSAVGAALCSLLMIIALYVPFIGMVAAAASGIPIVYLCVKFGKTSGSLAMVVGFAVAFILTGNVLSVGVLLLTYTLPGLIFGICSAQKSGFSVCIALMSLAILVGTMLEISVLTRENGIENLIDEYVGQLYEVVTQSIEASMSDINVDISEILKQSLSSVKEMILLYLPSLIIISSAVYSYAIASFGAFVMRRLGIKELSYLKPNEIHITKKLCYVTAVVGIITLFSGGNGIVGAALNNMFLILECMIGVCGFSIIDRKFAGILKVGYVRALIYLGVMFALFVLIPVILNIFVVIGFFNGMFPRDENYSPRR